MMKIPSGPSATEKSTFSAEASKFPISEDESPIKNFGDVGVVKSKPNSKFKSALAVIETLPEPSTPATS